MTLNNDTSGASAPSISISLVDTSFGSNTSGSITGTESNTGTASEGGLSPQTYLARVGFGQTTAEHEVWETAHRLYVILTYCCRDDDAKRAEITRILVRLARRHRKLLLPPSHASVPGSTTRPIPASSDIEACTICKQRKSREEAASSASSSPCTRNWTSCCWYRPGAEERSFLSMLSALCDEPELTDTGMDTTRVNQVFGFTSK